MATKSVKRSVRAVAQLPPRALRAPLVGAASADHTHRQSGRQRASACCICASTTAPGPSRYLAATHRQRRHLRSHSEWVRPHAQRRCVGELVRAHCGWVEGREREARESSVERLACPNNSTRATRCSARRTGARFDRSTTGACEQVSSYGCLGLSSGDAPSVSVRQLHTLQRLPD